MFYGLKDLFMLVDAPESVTKIYWRAVLHYKSTLKRVVYHERSVHLNDESPTFQLPADNGLSWDRSMVDVFPGGDLECIGLCDSPVYLVCPEPSYRRLMRRRTDCWTNSLRPRDRSSV